MHLEKMKKDCDDLELQNQAGAKKIEAWSQKCSKLMTEQEALNRKCKTLIKEQETWKHACAEMAKGICRYQQYGGTHINDKNKTKRLSHSTTQPTSKLYDRSVSYEASSTEAP
jgi:hypothetical protein